jgi:two-component system response regulator YesN
MGKVESMKAIIIDDEKHVREGLVLLADWDRFGIDTILEAEDGEEAIRLITEHHPEIIFTDMNMPRRDGVSLLRWLHDSPFNNKTIVVSGYDDYEYMRNAIFYKSFDYILKPIDPDILNQTLQRAVTEWHEQALSRKTRVEDDKVVNEVKPLYWDHLFSRLLTNEGIPPSVIEKIEKEFNLLFRRQRFTVAIIPIQPYLTKEFQGDIGLTSFALINICNELLRKRNSGISFKNVSKDDELVILIWNQKVVSEIIEQVYSQIYQFINVRCTIAVGQDFSQVVDTYESAVYVYRKNELKRPREEKKIVTDKDIHPRPILHLFDYSQDIKWAIHSGNIEKVDEILNRVFNKLQVSHNLSLEQLEEWENQFVLLSKHWLQEYEISDKIQLYKGKDYWNVDGSFSFEKFQVEKRNEFHDLIKTLLNVKFQKEKNSIQLIEEYLRSNYQKDVNLQEIADQFFLSREYISRKFKHEYHETITDYLMKIRMEKAKELLQNPHLKIYEIANHVGYQNEKYFSKLFKKMIGLTPNEYRSSLASK